MSAIPDFSDREWIIQSTRNARCTTAPEIQRVATGLLAGHHLREHAAGAAN
jgi:hypothetical protein